MITKTGLEGQIASLDGLRAVSIAIVFASHAGVSAAIPGGFGVTVFFFLSGYLITALLDREFARTGGIDLGAFYMRRVLRLGPPILVTLALGVLLVWLGVFQGTVDGWTLASQVFFYYNYTPSPAEAEFDGLTAGLGTIQLFP